MKFTKSVDDTVTSSAFKLYKDNDKTMGNANEVSLGTISSESWNADRTEVIFTVGANFGQYYVYAIRNPDNTDNDIIDNEGNQLKDEYGDIVGPGDLIKYSSERS